MIGFHGGIGGFAPGDALLPALRTGYLNPEWVMNETKPAYWRPVLLYDRSQAYFACDLYRSRLKALKTALWVDVCGAADYGWPDYGAVYLVESVGPVGFDPAHVKPDLACSGDHPADDPCSWSAAELRVLEVVEAVVEPWPELARELFVLRRIYRSAWRRWPGRPWYETATPPSPRKEVTG